jgi:hypothetical protein
MPVIIQGQTGATWALNAESGVLAQKFDCETSVEENPSRNTDGEFQMTSWFNPQQVLNLVAVSLGGSLATAVVGTAIALANAVFRNGVSSGGIYLRRIRQSGENTAFVSVSLEAVRRPLIP